MADTTDKGNTDRVFSSKPYGKDYFISLISDPKLAEGILSQEQDTGQARQGCEWAQRLGCGYQNQRLRSKLGTFPPLLGLLLFIQKLIRKKG